MRIDLSPVQTDEPVHLSLAVQGDTIIINGAPLDLAPIGEGDELPASAVSSAMINDPIKRIDGDLHIRVLLAYGRDEDGNEPPEDVRFPAAILASQDGPVELPTPAPEPAHPAASPIAVDWTQLIKYAPPPPPPPIEVPGHVFFSRVTDDEAEAIDGAMMAKPLRIRRQWSDPRVTFVEGTELWNELRGVIVGLYGQARADELLARPAPTFAATSSDEAVAA